MISSARVLDIFMDAMFKILQKTIPWKFLSGSVPYFVITNECKDPETCTVKEFSM